MPNRQFASERQAAATNGRRGPISPSSPPISGPAMKPTPNAAPIRPKFCARFSGGLMSAM